MRIRILKSAQVDLREGYWFYESQGAGLGDYVLDSLNSDIESLKIYAGVHGKYFKKYHRLLAKRFPFAVYYRVQNKDIINLRCFRLQKRSGMDKKAAKVR